MAFALHLPIVILYGGRGAGDREFLYNQAMIYAIYDAVLRNF